MRHVLLASGFLATLIGPSLAAKAVDQPEMGFIQKVAPRDEGLRLLTNPPLNTAVPLGGIWWHDLSYNDGTHEGEIYSFGHAAWDEGSRKITFDARGPGVVSTALAQEYEDTYGFPRPSLGIGTPSAIQISANGQVLQWQRGTSSSYTLNKTNDSEYVISTPGDLGRGDLRVASHKLRQIIDGHGQKTPAYAAYEKAFTTRSIVSIPAPVIDNGDKRSLDLRLDTDETWVIVRNVQQGAPKAVIDLSLDAPSPVSLAVSTTYGQNAHTSRSGHDVAVLVPAYYPQNPDASMVVIKSVGTRQSAKLTARPGTLATMADDGTAHLALAKDGEAYVLIPSGYDRLAPRLAKMTASPASAGISVLPEYGELAALDTPYYTVHRSGYFLIQSASAQADLIVSSTKMPYNFVNKGTISKPSTIVGSLSSPDTVFIYNVEPELAKQQNFLYAYLPTGPQGKDCCVAMSQFYYDQDWPRDPTSADGLDNIMNNPNRQITMAGGGHLVKTLLVFFDSQGPAKNLDYAIQLREGNQSGMYCEGNHGLGFGRPWHCEDGDCHYKDDGVSFDSASACVRRPGL